MGGRLLLVVVILMVMVVTAAEGVVQVGFNWGLKSFQPLPAEVVVRLLRDNGVSKVKLFEAEPRALRALGKSGIQVMVGIPNELLAPMAASVSTAVTWVMQNVSTYVSKYGVDIGYVAVGNEPFLKTYKGMYQETTFPALQNVQAALIKAGLSQQVKVTVPLNADVYQSDSNLPSGGDFRPDIRSLMLSIVRFLLDNNGPLTINIYPFLSLYADPNFPIDYAFFDGSASPVLDGPVAYTNVFEANYDTLLWALDKHGLSSARVIVGEIGWPTDGNPHANPDSARRFNQGLLDRVIRGQGTPKRPSPPPDIYLFGLLDEDAKSVDPGDFERHWGVFYYDGTPKYPLSLDAARPQLLPAKGVRYLDRRWCVLSPEVGPSDPNVAASMDYACGIADCTSLGQGSSCGGLDARGKASYAFNQFFQVANQQKGACSFSNLSTVTTTDPSPPEGLCKFKIAIDATTRVAAAPRSSSASSSPLISYGASALLLASVLCSSLLL
uniref:glucan endo-1,3-beta-D-glucosidase n=1 Tax=Anthurium amnicola TaxID=1678845 RepID=A0A1D1XFN9_9ARAE